jgi:alpha-tubulin suppressor-like RCC1 family protein
VEIKLPHQILDKELLEVTLNSNEGTRASLMKKWPRFLVGILAAQVWLLPCLAKADMAAAKGAHKTAVQVVAMACGDEFSLALKSDGTVWGWGRNNGQLGDGTTQEHHQPVQVPGLSAVTAIACGAAHSLALTPDGSVWSWGQNEQGQLGNGQFGPSVLSPARVPGLDSVVAIAAGGAHCLALQRDGSVWAWGDDFYGEAGNGTDNRRILGAVKVTGLTAENVACGQQFCVARGKAISAWGLNSLLELGVTQTGESFKRYHNTPVTVEGVSNCSTAVALACGATHTLFRVGMAVYSWGDNGCGQLGRAGNWLPAHLRAFNGATVSTVGCGFNHSLAITEDGAVWTWGNNDSGQLGDGTKQNQPAPMCLTMESGFVAVTGGRYHSLALKSDGTVFSWGGNQYGQLGNGSTDAQLVPKPIAAF